MRALGFEQLHRDDVFGNYLLGPLRVDLLFTQGKHSQQMLRRAQAVVLRDLEVKLLCPEDLIGLKLQALANNPQRPHDRSDIELLIAKYSASMDMVLVREYFQIFDREADLNAILTTVAGRDK